MVYKIRNKGFTATFASGASTRVLAMPKMQLNPDLGSHITLQTQVTRFNGMRILHSYRNISRATKQFLNGDRILEQLMILTLRDEYFRPMTYKAPIEQSYMIVSRYTSPYSSNSFPLLGTYPCRYR